MADFDPIVVTGIGAVSPLGVGVKENWTRLMNGQCGIVQNDRFDTREFKCTIAGLVPDKQKDAAGFDPHDWIEKREIKKMDLFIQYAIACRLHIYFTPSIRLPMSHRRVI